MTKVAVPGLEPRLREPESRVLPLHHTAKKESCPTETRIENCIVLIINLLSAHQRHFFLLLGKFLGN